jgi:N-acetylglucosamine-6-phosphate deacetylase
MASEENPLTMGFSIQYGPDKKPQFIGLHIEGPFTNYALALHLEWAKALHASIPESLGAVIAQFEQQSTGLVIAPATTLNTLKGK